MRCEATDYTLGSPLLGFQRSRSGRRPELLQGGLPILCPHRNQAGAPNLEPQPPDAHGPSTPSLPPSSQPHAQASSLEVSPHCLLPSLSQGTKGGDPLCFSNWLSSGPGPAAAGRHRYQMERTQSSSGVHILPPEACPLFSGSPPPPPSHPCCLPTAYQAVSAL